jgi:hypothetical protein
VCLWSGFRSFDKHLLCFLSLWGASCCVMYTYTFQIYLRSQLIIYWCYFSLCSQHVSAPTGHLQVKYNYITYISWESHRIRCNIDGFLKICKWCTHVVNREKKVTPINSQLRSQVYLEGIHIFYATKTVTEIKFVTYFHNTTGEYKMLSFVS